MDNRFKKYLNTEAIKSEYDNFMEVHDFDRDSLSSFHNQMTQGIKDAVREFAHQFFELAEQKKNLDKKQAFLEQRALEEKLESENNIIYRVYETFQSVYEHGYDGEKKITKHGYRTSFNDAVQLIKSKNEYFTVDYLEWDSSENRYYCRLPAQWAFHTVYIEVGYIK